MDAVFHPLATIEEYRSIPDPVRYTVPMLPDQMDALTHFSEIRRSTSVTQEQERYGGDKSIVAIKGGFPDNPRSYKDVMSRPDRQKWNKSVTEEIITINQKPVWTLEDLPHGTKFIATGYVYQVKKDANRYIEQYKARLAAKRFS